MPWGDLILLQLFFSEALDPHLGKEQRTIILHLTPTPQKRERSVSSPVVQDGAPLTTIFVDENP